MAHKKHYSPIKSRSGSGPTKAAGHIDSIMGGQYPRGMSVRQTGGTGRKRRR